MDVWQLQQLQSLSLDSQVARTERKIAEWLMHWNGAVYLAWSGGRDSTVLRHIIRQRWGDSIPSVFCDTGLEFPSVRKAVTDARDRGENVVLLKPKLTFKETLEKYGYPVVSKRVAHQVHELRHTKSEGLRTLRLTGLHPRSGKTHPAGKVPKKWLYLREAPFEVSATCCDVMKKRPATQYEKKTGRKRIDGVMTCESFQRQQKWVQNEGCNAFKTKRPHSSPMSTWMEHHVREYASLHSIELPAVYSMGYDRTGCMFCMFGVHMEKGENRFQRMYRTHPKQWAYCMDKLGLREVLAYINVPCEPSKETA